MDTPPTTPPASALSGELDERERQIDEDYDWALWDPEVRRLYAGLVVAVYKKTILGSGKTHGEAIEQALKTPDCPPRHYLAKVYIDGYGLPR